MDITKENIKMCEKAVKVQEAWEPQIGDFVYVLSQEVVTVLIDSNVINKDWYIWLPRQDQFQEIVKKECLRAVIFESQKKHAVLYHFLNWAGISGDGSWKLYDYYVKDFTSMEQLWLAFVMQEKYNKKWNGKEWVGPDVSTD